MTREESGALAVVAGAMAPETSAVDDATGAARRHALPVVLALAALAAIWGYAWVAVKLALGFAEPFTFAAARAFLGSVALLALAAALRGPLRPTAVG